MLNRKKLLVAASIAGLMTTTIAMAGSSFPGQDSMKKTCCMNKCGGKHSCKGAKNSCGGQKNACKSECAVKGASDTAAKVADGKLTS